MIDFIDQKKEVWGVEPICKDLPIAPSTYYAVRARKNDPAKLSARQRSDTDLKIQIRQVWDENFQLYGARKIWHQLKREGRRVARCTIERLMRKMGLQGVLRGARKRTTFADPSYPTPQDLVERNFQVDSPNQLWVADFTYVATWTGFVYVAFVIDAYARTIVGWRVSHRMTTELTLDALEQALWARAVNAGLIHHSDHGGQYLSIRYSDRLQEVGLTASTGTVGDAYDNALAETINGLFKTEVIRKRGPWKNLEQVEFATLEWVHWYNTKRIMSSIGNIPPKELEMMYYCHEKNRLVESGLTQ